MKICIDAGHGGTDSGAVGVDNRLEKTDALKMALALQRVMEGRGHNVIMTRSDDSYPSISSRYQLANAAKADAYISLHRNAATPSANGVEVLYRTQGSAKTAAGDAVSRTLAEEIDRRIDNATGFRDRGAKAQNVNTAVLQKTQMPAVTVEAGFVTNTDDNIMFDMSFDAIIDAIADGLEAVMGTGAPAQATGPALPFSFVPGSRRGDSGERVAWIQQRLMRHWALPGGQIDGKFGRNTEQGVRLFQQARLNEGRDIGAAAPDGIVGPKTAAILAE